LLHFLRPNKLTMLATTFTIALTSLSFALAAPFTGPSAAGHPGVPASFKISGCSLKNVKLTLPANTGNVTVPAGQTPRFVTVGVGKQNYTCGATGTYTSIGAVAELYDASCAASNTAVLDALPSIAFDTNQNNPGVFTILNHTPLNMGPHTFVTNPTTGTGIVPRFDFTQSQRNSNDFVDCTKTGSIAAPTDPTCNVNWLALQSFQGGLAKTVFRVYTNHGQPPASCTPGQSTSVNYAALYYFFA